MGFALRMCVRLGPIVLEPKELVGKSLNEDALRAAVQDARKLAQPMPDVRGSATYKREMAVEFAYRALSTAWERALREKA